MTPQEAKKIIDATVMEHFEIEADRSCVDGWFTADQLEAIAVLMREISAKGKNND